MSRELPTPITKHTTCLSTTEHTLLRKKQRWLQTYEVSVPDDSAHIRQAVNATLVFAQDCAGTAVCVSPDGLLLTCSHCVAETEEDYLAGKNDGTTQWLMFASGRIVQTKCVAWDAKLDLALLRVVAAQAQQQQQLSISTTILSERAHGTPADPIELDEESFVSSEESSFPSVKLPAQHQPLAKNRRVICIGHPGSEDLEVDTPGVKTDYDVLHVSEGRSHGHAKDQDIFDNSEIGALMHDCWTYWGHSGAPLIDRAEGTLVGLHSSWDSETGMRRGITLLAITQFLQQHEQPE